MSNNLPPPVDIALLVKAADFAARRHCNQKRQDVVGSPYINHPIGEPRRRLVNWRFLGVAHLVARVGGVTDIVTLAAAYLHDTIEDTKTTREELEREFGEEIALLVHTFTHYHRPQTPQERRHETLERAPRMPIKAKVIELADKIHNVRDMKKLPPAGYTRADMQAYAEWTRQLLNAHRGANAALEAELEKAINEFLAH